MRYLPVPEYDEGLGLMPGHEISFGDGFEPGSLWQMARASSGQVPVTTWVGIGLIAVGLWLVLGGRR